MTRILEFFGKLQKGRRKNLRQETTKSQIQKFFLKSSGITSVMFLWLQQTEFFLELSKIVHKDRQKIVQNALSFAYKR